LKTVKLQVPRLKNIDYYYYDILLTRILTLICVHGLNLLYKITGAKQGYQHDILQRSACMVINPSTVDRYPYLFGCTTVAGV
jgi:hypothetical protein